MGKSAVEQEAMVVQQVCRWWFLTFDLQLLQYNNPHSAACTTASILSNRFMKRRIMIMNWFYERFMTSFSHIHRSSGWQPKLQLKLKLKLQPHFHLKLLLLFEPRLKPNPAGDPRRSPQIPNCRRPLE